jgi:AcrR family transcriptional regulator
MQSAHPPKPSIEGSTDKGERARTRLLIEASRIFSEKGFAAASTREICLAAGLNVAAIHYHFAGKDGLYRAVLLGPMQAIAGQLAGFDDPALTLEQSLHRLLGAFVGAEDDAGGDTTEQGVRLYLREMIEPTAVFAKVAKQHIGPVHNAIAQLLARHIGIPTPDEDVQRLVFALVAMAQDYCMSRQFMRAVAPSLLDGSKPFKRARDRLVEWSLALVAYERARRKVMNTQE